MNAIDKNNDFIAILSKRIASNQPLDLNAIAEEARIKTSLARLASGEHLCLTCGFAKTFWTRRHGGISYPVCSECHGDAISYEHVTDGLGGTVSAEDWKQLQKHYPEIVLAAEQFE